MGSPRAKDGQQRPFVLIPGARVRDTATAERRDMAHHAMQAAIVIGQYLLAERIRRDYVLIACSLCGTCDPPQLPPRYRLRDRHLQNQVQDQHHLSESLLSDVRWISVKKPVSLLTCWLCYDRIGSETHNRTETTHWCWHVRVGDTAPESWLCQMQAQENV